MQRCSLSQTLYRLRTISGAEAGGASLAVSFPTCCGPRPRGGGGVRASSPRPRSPARSRCGRPPCGGG